MTNQPDTCPVVLASEQIGLLAGIVAHLTRICAEKDAVVREPGETPRYRLECCRSLDTRRVVLWSDTLPDVCEIASFPQGTYDGFLLFDTQAPRLLEKAYAATPTQGARIDFYRHARS